MFFIGKYPQLDMFVILTKLYIIPVRPKINGKFVCIGDDIMIQTDHVHMCC